MSIRVICYCYKVWYKEEDKEASKPAFLYTDTMLNSACWMLGAPCGSACGIMLACYSRRELNQLSSGVAATLDGLWFNQYFSVFLLRRCFGEVGVMEFGLHHSMSAASRSRHVGALSWASCSALPPRISLYAVAERWFISAFATWSVYEVCVACSVKRQPSFMF